MAKNDSTETLLLEAIQRLVSGQSKRTDGKLTQANVALEAGISRATFNRHPSVVESWRVAKRRFIEDSPIPARAKNRNRGQEKSDATLISELTEAVRKYQTEADAAQQKIAILNMLLVKRDETISNLRNGAFPYFGDGQKRSPLTCTLLGDTHTENSTEDDTAPEKTSMVDMSICLSGIENVVPFKK